MGIFCLSLAVIHLTFRVNALEESQAQQQPHQQLQQSRPQSKSKYQCDECGQPTVLILTGSQHGLNQENQSCHKVRGVAFPDRVANHDSAQQVLRQSSDSALSEAVEASSLLDGMVATLSLSVKASRRCACLDGNQLRIFEPQILNHSLSGRAYKFQSIRPAIFGTLHWLGVGKSLQCNLGAYRFQPFRYFPLDTTPTESGNRFPSHLHKRNTATAQTVLSDNF